MTRTETNDVQRLNFAIQAAMRAVQNRGGQEWGGQQFQGGQLGEGQLEGVVVVTAPESPSARRKREICT